MVLQSQYGMISEHWYRNYMRKRVLRGVASHKGRILSWEILICCMARRLLVTSVGWVASGDGVASGYGVPSGERSLVRGWPLYLQNLRHSLSYRLAKMNYIISNLSFRLCYNHSALLWFLEFRNVQTASGILRAGMSLWHDLIQSVTCVTDDSKQPKDN